MSSDIWGRDDIYFDEYGNLPADAYLVVRGWNLPYTTKDCNIAWNPKVRCWYQNANVGETWPPEVDRKVDWDNQVIFQVENFLEEDVPGIFHDRLDFRDPNPSTPYKNTPGYFYMRVNNEILPYGGGHWCIGCYLFADNEQLNYIYESSSDGTRYQKFKPNSYAWLAQVNYWVLGQRADENGKGTVEFVDDLTVANSYHEPAWFIVQVELTPDNFTILPDTYFRLYLDSLSKTIITFTITGNDVEHGDTAVVEYKLFRENLPCDPEFVGGYGHTLVVDNVGPQPPTELDVTWKSPGLYEISWVPLYTDSLGYTERISGFEIHCSPDPDDLLYPDSNTLCAVTGTDKNHEKPGMQHVVDPISPPMYFTVVIIDAAGNRGLPADPVCAANVPPEFVDCPPMANAIYVGQTVSGQVGALDPDDYPGSLSYSVISFDGPGGTGAITLNSETGYWEWQTWDDPSYVGNFQLCIAVTDGGIVDECNTENADTCCIAIQVDPIPAFTNVNIEKIHNAPQGHFVDVGIFVSQSTISMGGFDFLIAYDAAALTFTEAEPGQLLDDCDWEYFSYRHGANGNCGDACPSGLLRIIAIAETNDGSNHPSCYGPPDLDSHELARLNFYVTNDRTFECQYVPIYFFWSDCGDNTISSVSGDTLYIDHSIYDYTGNLIWDEEDDDQFPEDARIPFVGAPDYCLNPDPEKPSAIRLIDFVNGGIDIICADSIDVRGDINLNGAANEIADAVVFTNYFIYGLAAFTINQEGQIAATDVNADGMVLSVADLTYLIRIIVGDALPIPKLLPVTAKYNIRDGILSVDQEMGAAYVVIKGYANPVNLTDNMEMKYAYDSENDVTKVLLYSMEKGHRFADDFLELNGTLIEIEIATYEGATVKLITDLLPTEFVLHQNKPNPFNPITDMSFSLPVASDVILEIYNITGQKVATVANGHFEAGTHTVRWDGSDYASGIYMYRITAGEFTDSRKMLLLK